MRFLAEIQAADGPVKYHRVNVVLHGLMAFWATEPGYYDVLIPRTTGDCSPHFARFGNPLDLSGLHDFREHLRYPAPTRYKLEGVIGASASQECQPSAANALLLRSALIDLKYENILVTVRVPKPNMIRHYRGAETRGLDLTGGHVPSQSCLFRPPDVVHDITVFSYFAFEHPRLVGPECDYEIRANDLGAGNLHIYCQPTAPCTGNDSNIFSSMFHIKSAGCQPQIDLSLANIKDDGPPIETSPSVGIYLLEWITLAGLDALKKRAADQSKSIEHIEFHDLAAAPGGCGGAFGS